MFGGGSIGGGMGIRRSRRGRRWGTIMGGRGGGDWASDAWDMVGWLGIVLKNVVIVMHWGGHVVHLVMWSSEKIV